MAEAKKMVSLKRTPEDKKKDMGEQASIEAIAPDFPWGTCIHQDRDELQKLGMKKLPEIGATFTMTAKVMVTRKSESAAVAMEGQDPDESMSIDLQITDAAIE